MDIDDLRGVATIFCMLAFAAVVYWAYAPSRKSYFEAAAMLPFEDSTELENEDAAASPGKGDSDE